MSSVQRGQVPGCPLAYPTGTRGFSSLCSSGTLLSMQLDAKGGLGAGVQCGQRSPLPYLLTRASLFSEIQHRLDFWRGRHTAAGGVHIRQLGLIV
jgi:hypothetical protein